MTLKFVEYYNMFMPPFKALAAKNGGCNMLTIMTEQLLISSLLLISENYQASFSW